MNMLLISYSLTGFATAIIGPMCLTLVGENLALDKRARAISWIMTGAALAYVIGAPIINTISDIGGWRLSFLGYVAPAAIISLLMVRVSIPRTERSNPQSSAGFLSGFKAVSRNSSALSCMFGNAMVVAAYQAILYYGSSFFRQVFQTSRAFASLLIIGSALSFTLGSQVGGRLVNSYGRKLVSAIPAFLGGVVIICYMNIPNLYISILLRFLGSFLVGVSFIGSRSLTLEQEPDFRGTMMSLNSASQSFGTLIGSGVGGYLILRYSYNLVGLVLGMLGILSGLVYWKLSVDPTQKEY
jgi:DHA1 family L-arabinose/isopropyl-beta-D-thiogalactopyranoside export protein-like MFS transporter